MSLFLIFKYLFIDIAFSKIFSYESLTYFDSFKLPEVVIKIARSL